MALMTLYSDTNIKTDPFYHLHFYALIYLHKESETFKTLLCVCFVHNYVRMTVLLTHRTDSK